MHNPRARLTTALSARDPRQPDTRDPKRHARQTRWRSRCTVCQYTHTIPLTILALSSESATDQAGHAALRHEKPSHSQSATARQLDAKTSPADEAVAVPPIEQALCFGSGTTVRPSSFLENYSNPCRLYSPLYACESYANTTRQRSHLRLELLSRKVNRRLLSPMQKLVDARCHFLSFNDFQL